jgi:hypothetical protein
VQNPWDEIDRKLQDKGVTGLGEVMEVMYKRKGVVKSEPEEIQQLPHLHEKICRMLKSEPQEVHRLVKSDKYISSRLKAQGKSGSEEWAEEHEAAYKSIMRKSYNFSTIAKTMRFRELAKELPEKRTYLNEEWKFDQRSPWLNDLDYHSPDYFEVLNPPNKVGKSISNIRTSNPVIESLTPSDQELKRLQKELGKMKETNLSKLRREAKETQKVKDFQDAMACFEHLPVWEKSAFKFEKAKKHLTDYLIGTQLVEMKKLNLARYTYLSSKIASQRAKLELERKLLAQAEEKRLQMRARQEDFQRTVTVMRAVVRQKYGSQFHFRPRRVLKNTEAKLGSPLFVENMVRLGYLPLEIKPEPQRMNPGGQIATSPVNLQISPSSFKNLSKMNKLQKPASRPSMKLTKHQAASRIQALIKGWLWRLNLSRMKKAVKLFQRGFRRYRAWKSFLKSSIIELFKNPNPKLRATLYRYSQSEVFKRALKEVKAMRGIKLISKGKDARTVAEIAVTPVEESKALPDVKTSSSQLPVVNMVNKVLMGKRPSILIIDTSPEPSIPTYDNLDEYGRQVLTDEADEVNQLIRQIAGARAEMWRVYLCSVTQSSFSDDDVVKVLAKTSMYTYKQKTAGSALEWRDSFFQHPIFKTSNLSLVSDADLFSHDTADAKLKLKAELSFAQAALAHAKEKYAMSIVDKHQFDCAVMSSLVDPSTVEIPRVLPESEDAQE